MGMPGQLTGVVLIGLVTGNGHPLVVGQHGQYREVKRPQAMTQIVAGQ